MTMFLHFLWKKIAKSPVKIHLKFANLGKIRVFEKIFLRRDAKSIQKSKGIFSCQFGCSLSVYTCYFLKTSPCMSYIGGQTKRNTLYIYGVLIIVIENQIISSL